MTALLVLFFAAIAAVAIGFAAWPAWRACRSITPPRGRTLLAGAIALFMLVVAGGAYWMLGQPQLALRTLQGNSVRNLNGLIGLLVKRVREEPNNIVGWTLLGRAYLTAGDPGDAAKAFQRAIALHPDPDLYSAYGEALVEQTGGAPSDEAQVAFKAALAANPKDPAARYYLGLAAAARGDAVDARTLWESLLSDLPASSPQHRMLADRIAMMGGPAPDISAMVAALAARLKTAPNDAEGWQRLVRACAVLGKTGEAKAALADARRALGKHPDALAALAAEAKELKLE